MRNPFSVLEAELHPDTRHAGGQDVGNSAERPAQVGNRDRRATVDQVEDREIHIQGISIGGPELLGHPQTCHRNDGTGLGPELLHPERNGALQQPRIRKRLRALSLGT